MSRLIAAGTGNFTTAATWQVCDTAMVIDSEAGTLNITTSTSTHISPNSTPGAITVDGIAVKISSRVASPSGTFTVVLRNTTAGSDVTSVVINVTDIPAGPILTEGAGWCFFKFGSSQLLLAATNYAVRLTCSVNNEVTVYRSTASAQEYCRLLRTTTTAAPGTGDQLIISKEYLSAGSSNALVVTGNMTAATVYGATTFVDSISVSGGGTFTWASSASTNYLLTVAGFVTIWAGSTWNQGTSVTRIPSTSTAKLLFSVATNVDSGFSTRGTATVNRYGNIVTTDNTLMTASIGGYVTTVGTAVTKISGQSFTGLTGTIVITGVSYTISSVTDATHIVLTGSAGTQSTPTKWTHAGTANVVTVASTSGWVANDILGFAPTGLVATDSESATIQSVDSSTQVTLTTALTNQHSGDSPTQAEVIHLTRNVVVGGTSASLQGFVTYGTTATVNDSYVEFYWLGSGTASKRGIDMNTTTGSYTAIGCTHHDSGTNSHGWTTVSAGAAANNISLTYSHCYNVTSINFNLAATSASNITFDHCISIKAGGVGVQLSDVGTTVTNMIVVGATGNAITITQASPVTGTISNLTAHSCANQLIVINNLQGGTISNLTWWRTQTSPACTITTCHNTTFSTLNGFGCSQIIQPSNSNNCKIIDLTTNGDIIQSSTSGISLGGSINEMYFINASMGVVSGIKTAHTSSDVTMIAVLGKMIFRNSLFASTNELSSQSSMSKTAQIVSEKHDQTAGSQKRWEREGTATIDTVTYKTASPAETLTPISSSNKFSSTPTQPIPIDNGQTATITVYVNKSASYNGNQPRLILKRNDSVGITADTVLATASGGTGSWLSLSGTTIAVTATGAIVCYVDCDGTAGTVTIDDWSVS